MEAPLSRASADAPSPSSDVARPHARGARGASASTLAGHAETAGGIEQGVAEVMEVVDEDGTEEESSERRAPVRPIPSVEARREPRQEVEGSDDGLGARAGAEEGTAAGAEEGTSAGAEEGAAVSEAELTELRLRAPAGLTTDELRYMLSQSVADCAAALPDISAAMVWDACPKRLGGAAAR